MSKTYTLANVREALLRERAAHGLDIEGLLGRFGYHTLIAVPEAEYPALIEAAKASPDEDAEALFAWVKSLTGAQRKSLLSFIRSLA